MSAAPRSGSSKRIHTVVVDGLVLLRLIKHSREYASEQSHQTVSRDGTLLGLEVDGVLEVTNCFPSNEDGSVEYSTAVMNVLKEINVDNHVAGWYSSMYLGKYFTKENVEHHAFYQETHPDSILLMYDNVSSAQGLLSLKALRLTDAFMEEWRSQSRLGSEAFTRLAPSSIFEELPIKVRALLRLQLIRTMRSRLPAPLAAAETHAPHPIPLPLRAQVRNPHLIQAFMADLIDSKVLSGPGAISSRPTAAPTNGLAHKQSPLFSASSSIAASVGTAVGVTPAAVTAAELETDFARLDLATGACKLQRRSSRVAWPLTFHAAPSLQRFPYFTAPFLEKHLELIQGMGEQFLNTQANARFISREIAQLVKDREDWLILRRRENEKRRLEGLEMLPEFDASLPFFKPVMDKTGRDTLDSLLISAQISAYCGSVMRFADQSFGKLFLAASLQKQ